MDGVESGRMRAVEICEDHISVSHPHLFEISAWPWLERISRREGRHVTLASVPSAEWDAIGARGFTFVFLMGIWRRSAIGRELAQSDPALRHEYDRALPDWAEDDVVGSPYCIRDYEPDPRMGGWEGLDRARAEVTRRGMRLVVDFVPNHTAFDHPWVTAHPDRYVQGTAQDAELAPGEFRRAGDVVIACARDPYFPAWQDVAQLNYFNAGTRHAMIDVLTRIAAHADGVRCDMAMLVLNGVFDRTWRRVLRDRWPPLLAEFWPAATRDVPELVYLAEVYWDLEWTLQEQGFHYTYDKRLLDRLHASSPDNVRAHLRADAPYRDRLVRFLENHDEPRSAVSLAHRLLPAATLVATLPGLRFFFDGQLEGRRVRTPVQLGRWLDEPVDQPIARLYDRLLRAAGDAVFHEGEWMALEVSAAGDETFRDLAAYRWRHGASLAVIVVNLGSQTAQAHIPIGEDVVYGGDAFDFEDVLTDTSYRWTRESLVARGLYVRLNAGGAHLFMARLI
jgi:hypothetical protein